MHILTFFPPEQEGFLLVYTKPQKFRCSFLIIWDKKLIKFDLWDTDGMVFVDQTVYDSQMQYICIIVELLSSSLSEFQLGFYHHLPTDVYAKLSSFFVKSLHCAR